MFDGIFHNTAFLTLTGLLLVAVGFDLRFRIIPNWVCACILVMGFVFQGVLFGMHGQIAAVTGVLMALAVFVPLYAMQWTGAGDAKLMAAVGAFLGPIGMVNAIVFTFIAGGMIALTHIVGRQSAVVAPRLLIFFAPNPDGKVFFPFAVAIAAGSVCAQFFTIVNL